MAADEEEPGQDSGPAGAEPPSYGPPGGGQSPPVQYPGYGPPGSYDDFEHADVFFVIGANMADCHPILYLRMMDRVHAGARLIVVDPRRTATADKADELSCLLTELTVAGPPVVNPCTAAALTQRADESSAGSTRMVTRDCIAAIAGSASFAASNVSMPTRPSTIAAAAQNGMLNLASSPVAGRS